MNASKLDKPAAAATPSIRMGEMSVASGNTSLRTLLGSCIGLALYDSRHQIAGLAHIVLATSNGEATSPGKYADTAIPLLIEKLKALSPRRLKLEAKIAGGASMFSTTVAAKVGRRNAEACEEILTQLRIPIVARHCGGEQGRRMLLDVATGKVLIEIVGQSPIEI